jgi:hypothetical protein
MVARRGVRCQVSGKARACEFRVDAPVLRILHFLRSDTYFFKSLMSRFNREYRVRSVAK